MAQLRKALRQVRPCSLLSAHQASMSIWPQDARLLLRWPSHCRKAVAYLIWSAANLRTLGVMWLRSARARSHGRTRQVAKSLIVLTCSGWPALEGAEVLVDRRQDSAGHQEFFQVSGGSPGLELVEGVVGQRDLAEAELLQQSGGVRRLAAAHGQPGQSAVGLVHRHQQVEQWDQRGTDATGAVVQERGEAVAERAALTQPSAQELALEAAA
ncbi:hypothetical protein [Streptomyces sp. Je 1-369]|uniref:hypothetical protein n=1 Tax=Streptomyces sp. Je 1-369 TaxID=2966192 RepID=UPI002286A793|nr:hypothetical protein [Streptomyces sp. Je 1-369]WAL98774.1 hypothetical protein NOO62_32440 [Streptomyces sp. Je 1-369]